MKFLFLFFCFLPLSVIAQNEWPLAVGGADGSAIKLYELKYDSLTDNLLTGNAVFSVQTAVNLEPIFGIYSFIAALEMDDSSDFVCVMTLDVTAIKFSAKTNPLFINNIKVVVQNVLPGINLRISKKDFYRDELVNEPPEIIYNTHPSILVLIDGEPFFHSLHVPGVRLMSNSTYPVLSVRNTFYLYAGGYWYKSVEPVGPFSTAKHVPVVCRDFQQTIDEKDKSYLRGKKLDTTNNKSAPDIFVRSAPAELIQSNGQAVFNPLEGTSLKYVANSEDDIFLDTSTSNFFVLLSGRWYTASTLYGPWHYVLSNELPKSFGNIQITSVKAGVRVSIAGTDEAINAVLTAGLPLIKKVKLSKTTLQIRYDGGPRFQNIPGSNMQYAINTQTPVVKDRMSFYAVDKGIWYEAGSAFGPWKVSVKRPAGIGLMQPACPIYNIKFVDVYEATRDYVYVGYTAGYLSTFINAETVVYGTGFRYTPWIDNNYVTRPLTWGYAMRYYPQYGWALGCRQAVNGIGFWGANTLRPVYSPGYRH